jgi:hypothetical protein
MGVGMGWVVLSFLFSSAFALDPVKFGPEFTFMADHTLHVSNFPQQAVNHLVHEQPEGCKFSVDQGYESRQRLISPNQWWFCISTDSGGHEVGMSPMSVAEYKKFEADIHDAIFVSAANSGYFPALWQGGGHINVDITEFRKNPLLFRNWIADMLSHGELFMGIFNYDISNQRPHQLASSDVRARVAQDFGLPSDPGFEVLANEMLRHVDEILSSGHGDETFAKMLEVLKKFNELGIAFSFSKINENRVELRGFRPQASIRVFINQIELIQKRLEYLEKFDGPIPVRLRMDIPDALADRLTPPVNPQEALKAFYEYVSEAGLRWADHRDYLWPQWQTGGELAFFENSVWFKEREERSCEDALKQ